MSDRSSIGFPASADSRLLGIADFLLKHRSAAEIEPFRLNAALLPLLFILAREQPADAAPLLRIRLTGTAIDEIFGRRVTGRCMEEFMHGPRSADVLRSFHQCSERQQPVWMRQVVMFEGRHSRFIEAVAVPLLPDRIYGGLVEGRAALPYVDSTFEQAWLTSAVPVGSALSG